LESAFGEKNPKETDLFARILNLPRRTEGSKKVNLKEERKTCSGVKTKGKQRKRFEKVVFGVRES